MLNPPLIRSSINTRKAQHLHSSPGKNCLLDSHIGDTAMQENKYIIQEVKETLKKVFLNVFFLWFSDMNVAWEVNLMTGQTSHHLVPLVAAPGHFHGRAFRCQTVGHQSKRRATDSRVSKYIYNIIPLLHTTSELQPANLITPRKDL